MLAKFFTWLLVVALLVFAGDTLAFVLKRQGQRADCKAFGGLYHDDGCQFDLRRPVYPD